MLASAGARLRAALDDALASGAPAPRVTLAPAPLGLAALWLELSLAEWPRAETEARALHRRLALKNKQPAPPKKNKQPKGFVPPHQTNERLLWLQERLDVALEACTAEP